MPIREAVSIALSGVLVILIVVTGWSLNAFRRYQPYSGFLDVNPNPDRHYLVLLSNVDIRGRSSGQKLWGVHAQNMTLSLDRSKVTATGVTNGVMLEQSKPKLNFVADRAIYSTSVITPTDGNIDVAGRIHITSTGPISPIDARVVIDASRATWIGSDATLQCPEPLKARFVRADWKQPVYVNAQALDWNSRTRILHFRQNVTMNCPVPNSPALDRMTVTSANVVWQRQQSLVQCNSPAHVIYPLAHSRRPIVIDALTASYDQRSGIVDCPRQALANLQLPDSNTNVVISAAKAVWTPRTGTLVTPAGAHADISSLGVLDCQTGSINTRSHAMDFSRIHLVADSSDIAPPAAQTPPPPDGGNQTAPPAPESKQGEPQKNAQPGTPSAPAADQDRVYVDAPQGGHWDEQTSTLTLRGPVKFTQGDAVMSTIGAIYNRKANTAEALSPVTLTDPENTLTGKRCTINFKTKTTVVTGDVRIKQVPKDQPAKSAGSEDESIDDASKQPTDMTCDKIVYHYHDKQAEATGHLVIIQKHRTVTADSGTYDAHTKIAHLEGNVIGKTDDDRVLKAPRATISIKKGDQWIEFPGQVNFEFTPSDEDNPRVKDEKSKSKSKGEKPNANGDQPKANTAPAPPPTAQPAPPPSQPPATPSTPSADNPTLNI